jgi:hypothetical protein
MRPAEGLSFSPAAGPLQRGSGGAPEHDG